MANSVDPDQTSPIGAVCSGSMLFASKLTSSVMLGNYLQQTTFADDILRCIFFTWRFKGKNVLGSAIVQCLQGVPKKTAYLHSKPGFSTRT